MTDVLLDALVDSLKILVFVFVFNILFALVEPVLTKKLSKKNKINPLTGAAFGLIPQCGVSVIGADLYIKSHITMGSLVAIFIACSDEAIPIVLSEPTKAISVIPLLLCKLIIGFVVGFIIDFVFKKSIIEIHQHKEECHHEYEVKIGCCSHEINLEENKLYNYLIHPLVHSLKLFIYVFLINLAFGTIIYLIGEKTFVNILNNNKYFTPLYATIIGLIPNCASSVIITNLYITGKLSFGTTLAGLISNSGLGLLMLLKNKKMIKKTIVIIAILVLTALVSGYVINLIFGF